MKAKVFNTVLTSLERLEDVGGKLLLVVLVVTLLEPPNYNTTHSLRDTVDIIMIEINAFKYC